MMDTEFQTKVTDYIKSDRCWFREHRQAHAAYQLKNAKTEADRKFWKAIVDVLKD
jgi:hypothetical protein